MESRSTALNIKWRCNSLMLSKHSEQRLQLLQWSTEGSMNAFCEKVKRPANEKTALGNHGNCRFWQLSLAAPARGVSAWRTKRSHQPVRSLWISRQKSWKTNQNVKSLAIALR